MFFTKYPHPANFSFAENIPGSGTIKIGKHNPNLSIENFDDQIARLTLSDPKNWAPNQSLAPLDLPKLSDQNTISTENNQILINDQSGKPLIKTVQNRGLGIDGHSWIVQFEVPEGTRYYGMGQKLFNRLELSGYRTVFWNTDVWSDFHWAQWGSHPSDPSYFSTPYLAIKIPGKGYVGILVHDPAPVFIETPGRDDSRVFVEWQRTSEHLILGCYDGEPNLIVLTAPTLKELTNKFNRLVGTCPTPPLWSLGYHQSRWGYGGEKDLLALDKAFTKSNIPCAGLWLDLDYMEGYRIFQTNPKMFPNGVQSVAQKLAKNKRRIVPIIDPGVKFEPGYRVYDDGHKNNIFCKNQEGTEYVGLVWPGETVFPDFIQPKGQDWWANYCKEFLDEGYGACWIDMNDPSTGPVDPTGLLFNDGKHTHAQHRNQYALGMQMATRQGFLTARPNERPFMLSRSGYTGSSRYSAVWTGDNCSNDFYLQASITTSLGMALSGHVFNGPDLGGFGGDCSPLLMERWTQCCFLFPFMRNHSTAGTKNQEPFAFPQATEHHVGDLIRLRYRLLPYLYSLFANHESTGEPILRPLFYEFETNKLDEINDEFMVGPFILQAPIVHHQQTQRKVTLPGKQQWFDANTGKWLKPGKLETKVPRRSTPLFLRAGTILPLTQNQPTNTEIDLLNPLVLITAPKAFKGKTEFTLAADDGITFDHENGQRSLLKITLTGNGKALSIATEHLQTGFGNINPTFIVNSDTDPVAINNQPTTKTSHKLRLTGRELNLFTLSSKPQAQ